MSIFTRLGAWLSGAAKKVAQAFSIGVDFGNKVKNVVNSPLLDLVVQVVPTEIDNKALEYIRGHIGFWIDEMGWAGKKISDFGDSTLPHVLNSVSAEATKLYADYKKIDLSRPQAIAGAQVAYNGEIVK